MTSKLSKFPLLAFVVLVHPLLAFAQPAEPPYYYWQGPGHMWGGGWGHGWFGPLIVFFFIVLCIAVFFMLMRRACWGCHRHWGPPWRTTDRHWGPEHPGSDPTASALQILNERYARGEIQKPEYEEKKAAILSAGPR